MSGVINDSTTFFYYYLQYVCYTKSKYSVLTK